ncbi:hypothetical protein ASF29_06890 [Rhizobium sp. Leaf262]|nr:hypothetical protein ASF29_06890 [Rhizobium sp. Leaf262]
MFHDKTVQLETIIRHQNVKSNSNCHPKHIYFFVDPWFNRFNSTVFREIVNIGVIYGVSR